ncbi:MAG: TetM/TetW/TetO/TetS family tetracycline resistance ribosomal protection protein, partial [Lachnospiraceae bacterium]|nr:TetM/TetW/TetO/TetS family tetracycline resistance ribosomal protection protein [Lachnospiraceae bacterium]
KMDREGCDKDELQAQLESRLSDGCVEFEADGFEEKIALCDEDVMESFLETGELTDDTVRALIGERKLFPCFYGSALKLDGVDEFLDGLARYAPVPERESEFGARVYKIGRDNDGNRLTYMKITGGVLKNRDVITYEAVKEEPLLLRRPAEETPEAESVEYSEKVTQIRIYSGEKYETADIAEPGTVVAVLGLTATYAGQGLGVEEELAANDIVPVMTYKVLARDRSALQRLLPKFRILEEEDPTLGVTWNAELNELQISIMGEIQLEILKRRLMERFGEDVDFDR